MPMKENLKKQEENIERVTVLSRFCLPSGYLYIAVVYLRILLPIGTKRLAT